MQLGIHIGQQNMSMDEMRSLWRRCDGDLDWISVWDHLYEAPPAGGTIPHFEAVACLGALAADTAHARLGCLVFYVGYRNPGLLAKAATTIDHISAARNEAALAGQWGAMWERVSAGALLGTPDTAVDRVLEYRDAGADLINIAVRAPIDEAALEAYISETVPAVRAAVAP